MNAAKVLIVLAALLVAAIPALADEVESEARVTNRAPSVQKIQFVTADDDASAAGMQVVPIPGETRAVEFEVRVLDDNGHPDVRHVNVTFRGRDNVSVLATLAGQFTGGNGRSGTYAASVEVPYWLPPGTYHLEAHADDKPGARGKRWATFDVLESLAMGVGTAAVSFGSFQPGDQTAPASVGVRNLGNLPIDLEVTGGDLVAPEATIPASRVKASLAQSMDPMVALSLEPVLLDSFDLAPADGAARDVWFSLHVPTGDEQYVPQATYRGSLTVSAVVSG